MNLEELEQQHADAMRFYRAFSIPELIEAQARHIEKLQAKLPKDDQPALTKVREG